jgi:hypothetical protein
MKFITGAIAALFKLRHYRIYSYCRQVAPHPPIRLRCAAQDGPNPLPVSRGEGRLSQMAASDALACEIFVDELVIAGCAEAGEVAAVDD